MRTRCFITPRMSRPAVAAFLLLALVGFVPPAFPALNNPVPLINQPLAPDSAVPGGAAFTLAINGTGFVSGAKVNWNGSPRHTVFSSSSRVTATIPASDIVAASTASVTVVNPPPGGGRSNVAFFEVTPPVTTVAFSPVNYTVGQGVSEGIATGDLNGDGKLDLVIAAGNGPDVYIMLGNGDGTFQAARSVAVGTQAALVALGDFNGDGHIDIAVCGTQTDLFILLGNGDGTFQPYRTYTTDYESYAITVGDFSRDGKLDLAAASATTGNVSILLGNGDGTFQTNTDYPAGPSLETLFTGDFNRDGNLDLAVGGIGETFILLGNGDGSFQPPATLSNAAALAIADYNGDGIPDIAVVPHAAGNSILILLGNGDGTFQQPVASAAGQYPAEITTGDFNGDGKLDLAVAVGAEYPHGAVAILFGNGNGTFRKPLTSTAERGPGYLISGDFNGDGKLDLATINSTTITLSVLLQTTVSLSPGSLNFSPQLLGATSNPDIVTLTNNGSAALNIASLAVTGADAGDFSIASDSCTGPWYPRLALARSASPSHRSLKDRGQPS